MAYPEQFQSNTLKAAQNSLTAASIPPNDS